MSAVHYRLATDADGPAIGKLFAEASYPDHYVDWARARVAPFWLVAERDGALVGAVQVVASQPFGYIGEIVVDPAVRGRRHDGAGALRGRLPGAVATTLYSAALEMLTAAGSQIVYGFVSDELRGLQRVMQRFATDLAAGHLFARRLP